jgi:hemerythrin-like metal-binding protein
MTNSFELPDREILLSIPEEHHVLSDHVDALASQVDLFLRAKANQPAPDIEPIISLLNELSDIARSHFRHEEDIMKQKEFPGLLPHKRDHDYLLRGLQEFTSFVNGGAEELSNDVGTNLRSWLTFHIDKYDNAYLAFMEPPKAEEKKLA